jgi:hypothetical protein
VKEFELYYDIKTLKPQDKKMCPGPSSVMPPKGKGKKKCVNQGGSRRQCSQRASKEIVRDSSSESESSGEDHDDREYAPNSLEADRSYADRGNGAFRRSPPRGIAMRGALQVCVSLTLCVCMSVSVHNVFGWTIRGLKCLAIWRS